VAQGCDKLFGRDGMAMDNRAFSGVRVLDVTQHESGSTCTQLIGWMGADVIKVETPRTGDPGRKIGSPLQTSEPDPSGFDAWYFLMHNANKRSIGLDLKNPEGYQTFLDLVLNSDVVVENLGPGTMERLNLGYDVLERANPAIIFARIKGFGLTGPYSGYGSFDTLGQAAGGMMALTGPPGEMPLRTGPSVADTTSGIMCAFGVAAALVQRTRTGKGQLVELSMQEAVMYLTRGRFSDYYKNDRQVPERKGNSLIRGVPSGLFPCKGGGPNDYIYLISNSALQPKVTVWDNLLTVIGRTDLIGDERYHTLGGREERRAEIEAFVTDWTMQHSKHEVMRQFAAAGVLCSAVFDIEDQLNDEHLLERGAIEDYEHPTRGTIRAPGCPVRLSDSDRTTRRPPLIGEHTEEVITGVLGYDQDRVEALRAAGAI
jgi:formyl-CoA transferase